MADVGEDEESEEEGGGLAWDLGSFIRPPSLERLRWACDGPWSVLVRLLLDLQDFCVLMRWTGRGGTTLSRF